MKFFLQSEYATREEGVGFWVLVGVVSIIAHSLKLII